MNIEKHRFYEIDVIKIIAIILVIICHFYNFTQSGDYFETFNPYIGVLGLALFFFASGYTLYYNNNNIMNIKGVVTFYKKRLLRIYPLYIVLIIFTIIINYIFNIKNPYLCDFNLTNLLINILGLQVFFTDRMLVAYWWFVGVILLYYILYPLIIYVTNKYHASNKYNIVYYSIAIILLLVPLNVIFHNMDNRFFLYYLVFISGIVLNKINMFYDNKFQKYMYVFSLVLFITVLIESRIFDLGTFKPIFHLGTHMDYIYIMKSAFYLVNRNLLMISFCIITYNILMLSLTNVTQGALNLISKVSYGTYAAYLFHEPITRIVVILLNSLYINKAICDIIIIFILTPIILIISYYIQKFIDKIIFINKSR